MTLLVAMLTLLAPTKANAWGYCEIRGTEVNNGNEGCDKLFDGNIYTKWCVTSFENGVYVEFETTDPITPKGYVLTTGNDIHEGNRNPISWTIYAGNGETLASVEDASMPSTNQTQQVFSIDNDEAYQYFKFEIKGIKDGDVFELSEFQFLETDPALDLSFATIVGLENSYPRTGETITINYSLNDYSGNLIDSQYYTSVIKRSNGEVVEHVVAPDAYTLEISAKEGSGYSGSTSALIVVALWTGDGGYCGNTLENVYYEIATIDGKKTLTIRKNPYATTDDFKMKDYDVVELNESSVFAPWINANQKYLDGVFDGWKILCDIEEVVIEEEVTSIGNRSFYGCSNLTSITIPNSVTSIGEYAFDGCKGLTSITIPNSVISIGNCSFQECSNLTSITIPNGVTSIGIQAFYYCTGLTSVTIPCSVTSIGEYAFNGCKNVTDVYCYANPDGLTWVKCNEAFNSSTKFHVYENQLVNYLTKFPNANVQFVGDIPAPKSCVINVTATANVFGQTQTQTKTSGVHELPYSRKLREFVSADQASAMESFTIANVTSVGDNVVVGALNGWDTSFTVTDEGISTVTIKLSYNNIPSSIDFTITATRAFSVPANLANGAYWATFYSSKGNFQAPEGTQVFAVSLNGSTISLTEIGDRIVNQGQGVVLKKTTEGDFVMTKTASSSTDDYSTNSLTGTDKDVINLTNAYVLGYSSAAGVGFYKLAANGAIKANRAYLTYDGTLTRDYFNFEGATAISTATSESATQQHFDLMGRRVLKPTKGLYIVRSQGKNGKKVMIK